jgi:hypothetical protein
MLARALHKTVAELLTGRPQPLSSREYLDWSYFYEREAKEQERAMKKAKQTRGRRH